MTFKFTLVFFLAGFMAISAALPARPALLSAADLDSSARQKTRSSGILSYDYLRRDARKNGILSCDYLTQGPRRRHLSRRSIIRRPPVYRHRYYPSYVYGYYDYYPYYHPVRIYETAPAVIINHVEISSNQPALHTAQESDSPQKTQQQKLIHTVLRNGANDRKKAARALSSYENMSSVAVLVDVLINDADSEVRAAAAKSLCDIADPAAYEALYRSAATESDEKVRQASQLAADLIKAKAGADRTYVSPEIPPMNEGEPRLADHLEELRLGSAQIREKAADEMDDYNGTQAVCALINVLVNDPDEDVREEAAHTLGKIGDRMALPFLKWAKFNDPDKSVRRTADEAVDKIYLTIQ